VDWRRLGLATTLSLGLGSAVAQASITISVEDPNSRGVVDHYDVYDLSCGRALDGISLGGRTSDTMEICGDAGTAGALRIRYEGELKWSDYTELHGWSVVTLPERPKSRRPPPASDDAG
jgi:hypothetical protein